MVGGGRDLRKRRKTLQSFVFTPPFFLACALKVEGGTRWLKKKNEFNHAAIRSLLALPLILVVIIFVAAAYRHREKKKEPCHHSMQSHHHHFTLRRENNSFFSWGEGFGRASVRTRAVPREVRKKERLESKEGDGGEEKGGKGKNRKPPKKGRKVRERGNEEGGGSEGTEVPNPLPPVLKKSYY